MMKNTTKLYELIIKTTYNTIKILTDDYTKPNIQEILNQPYVLSVEVKEIKEKTKVRKRIL